MDGLLLWGLLLLGNLALFLLWVHWIARFLFGKCPHCGDSFVEAASKGPVHHR